MRSSACCSVRSDDGTGFLAKNCLTSAAASVEQKLPERADDAGDALEGAQLLRQRRPLRLDERPRGVARGGRARSPAISVPVSWVRTAGEMANVSVRCTSAGSLEPRRAH